VLAALVLPSAAFGQATRTWVSGVGDDVNPCSRTAPCKTFAGAISKTAPKGEINVLDPGGFGGVTITKAISIKAEGITAGVLVSGTNGITVNAAATDKVKLVGLDINGIGTGLSGVKILSAKAVTIKNSQIYEFTRSGVDFQPTNNPAKLYVSHVHIHDNGGDGVLVAPTSTGNATATLRQNEISDNACGVVAATFGQDPAFNFLASCGTLNSGGVGSNATMNAFGNQIADNVGTGVFSNGNKSTSRIGTNEISGNLNGLFTLGAGAPTAPNLVPSKRAGKRVR
jgi:hypothetical protein